MMSNKRNCSYCNRPVSLKEAVKCGSQYVFHKECYARARSELERLQPRLFEREK